MTNVTIESSVIRTDFEIKNKIQEAESEYIRPTFSLSQTEQGAIAYQNGIVVPDFMPQERGTVTLNGLWRKKRFNVDFDFSLEPRSEEWIEKAQEESNGAHLLTFDDSEWDVKALPQPENEMTGSESVDGAETYENGVWYRRAFELDETCTDKEIFLKSLGISYICDIWINGYWVGYHEGGYAPFAFDISPFVQFNEPNIIFIRVDNPTWGKRLDTIPAVEGTDFFNYTGIIQDIYIEMTDRVMLARADFITKDIDGSMTGKIVVSNYTDQVKSITIISEIFEADQSRYKDSPSIAGLINKVNTPVRLEPIEVELDGAADRLIIYDFSIENPKLWDVLEPNLYVSKISISDDNGVVIDTLYTQFGIRTAKTQDTKILLNDANFFARGIARHEEWPMYGRTASWNRIISDMDQIAGMGVNFIRTGHYPNHVYTYLYLDRLGIPSMSEIPLWQLESAHFKALEEKGLADQMFREMVFSQYNSASVIMWSTQNECRGIKSRTAYNERIVNDLRENYDDGRLITQSAAADQGGPNDASMVPLDVNGWTMYFGTFHGGTAYDGTKSFLSLVKKSWNKPVIITEYGTWSGESDSESTTQAEYYKQVFDALLEYATITPQGYLNNEGILAGIDYWIMYNWYVNHNNFIGTFGIFHMDREEMKYMGEKIRNDYTMLKEAERSVNIIE